MSVWYDTMSIVALSINALTQLSFSRQAKWKKKNLKISIVYIDTRYICSMMNINKLVLNSALSSNALN